MIYQSLYDEAKRRGALVVRIKDNVIPDDGYAIPTPKGMTGGIGLVENGEELFDKLVKSVVTSGKSAYLAAIFDRRNDLDVFLVLPALVFAKRDFAIGYCMGGGYEFVIDIATSKKIKPVFNVGEE